MFPHPHQHLPHFLVYFVHEVEHGATQAHARARRRDLQERQTVILDRLHGGRRAVPLLGKTIFELIVRAEELPLRMFRW